MRPALRRKRQGRPLRMLRRGLIGAASAIAAIVAGVFSWRLARRVRAGRGAEAIAVDGGSPHARRVPTPLVAAGEHVRGAARDTTRLLITRPAHRASGVWRRNNGHLHGIRDAARRRVHR